MSKIITVVYKRQGCARGKLKGALSALKLKSRVPSIGFV